MSTISKKDPEDQRPLRQQRPREASFTLLETIMALGLMVTVVLETSFIQGKNITFSEYNRKVTQASWLARAWLEKVEWASHFYDFKELKGEGKEVEFPETMCPPYNNEKCEFKLNWSIQEFKLPLVDLITNKLGMGGGDEEGDGGGLGGFGSMIEKQIKEFLGDELLKIAHVEVTWPEGSRRGSVELAYLVTNQRQLDNMVYGQKPLAGEKKSETPKKKEDKSREEDKSKKNGTNKPQGGPAKPENKPEENGEDE